MREVTYLGTYSTLSEGPETREADILGVEAIPLKPRELCFIVRADDPAALFCIHLCLDQGWV